MAMPAAAAAAVTSGSRTLPPGWATARTPAAASASTPSGNGKKASLPAAAPWARSPALATAIRTESTRLCWPAPTPTTRPSLASTIAFDFTLAATDQARARSASSSGPGGPPAWRSQPAGSSAPGSGSWASRPPATERTLSQPAGRAGSAWTSRSDGLPASTARASSSKPGATTTSVKTPAIRLAVAASSGRDSPTTPPKALTGSPSSAPAYASSRVAPNAEPFGEPTRREGRGHPAGDGGIIGGGAGECLGGEVAAFGGGGAAGGEGGLDLGVVGRVADDGDPGVVLGGGPHHGGAADVDALDGQGGGDVGGGDGLLERVEVDHDQVEGGDAGMLQLGPVAGLGTVGQEAGVDPGVEGLDPAVEELGEAGQLLDPGDGQAVP